ncbi:TetR/AcrR family transcriptional regulator [Candidatus Bipolaricaulota bacterium]|nr:TetR/AcrR family transcriptional regulator [Candidatus Bipolaricaulota bacterium]
MRTLDTKQQVLLVGHEMLLTEGLRAITTTEVARRAKISKKTLYRHFPNKEALLEAILVSFFEAQLAQWDAILEQPAPAMDRILSSLEFVSEFMPQIQHQLIDQVDGVSPQLWTTIDALRTRRLAKLKALMEEVQADGLLRVDVDPQHWILLLIGAIHSAITPQQLLRTGIPLTKLIATVKLIYFDGLLTEKGRRHIAAKEHAS